MKTKAAASKAAADEEDEAEPKKIQSSRSKRHRGRRRSLSSSGSESPPRKRSKKHSKRITDKKNKRSKVSSSSRRRHYRSLSPSRSLSSSSSPSSIARHSCSTNSSSSSERSLSPPPRSRSRDDRKKKGRGRGRERDHKRTKPRRSPSSSSTSASSGSSRSRSRSKSKHRKQSTVGGTTRDKIEIDYDNRHASRSEKNIAADDDRDEEALATIAKKGGNDIDRYKKNLELESPPSKNVNETEVAPAGGGNSDAEDLELILRQKALENFRKFRAAATAVMEGKTDTNGATGKEALIDAPQNAGTEIAEARSSAVNQFQRQGSRLVMKNSAGSPRSEDCGNGTSHSWKQEGSAGMSPGAASPRIPEAGDTGGPTQQKGRAVEATHSNCQFRSPQDGRNSPSVMQRLVSTPGSCASVNQRLGSSAGVSRVTGAPRVRSVVSIPARDGLDGSTYTTPPRSSEKSAPVESSSDIGRPLIDINKAERINGDDRKTSEASASNGSILSPAEGKSQARAGDKDGDQFQKKTFSRMHDGETVEVSYKVYIPKKTPALARRKLQR